MKQELKIANGTTAVMDTEKMIAKIQGVCAKVEKATDAYKSIMEEVYILHMNKIHKKSEYTSFVEFMHEKTGMGESTCKSLVAIQKHIEHEVFILESDENVSNDMVAEYRGFMKSASMRELLLMAKNEETTTEYVVKGALEIYLQDKIGNMTFNEALDYAFELGKEKYVKAEKAIEINSDSEDKSNTVYETKVKPDMVDSEDGNSDDKNFMTQNIDKEATDEDINRICNDVCEYIINSRAANDSGGKVIICW